MMTNECDAPFRRRRRRRLAMEGASQQLIKVVKWRRDNR